MSSVTLITHELDRKIAKVNGTRYKIKPWKQKKKSCLSKFFVQDGLIPFTVDVSELSCNCKEYMCNHLLFVLYHKIGLDTLGIFMMQYKELRDKLTQMITNKETQKNMLKTIWEEIFKWFDENTEACTICLEPQTYHEFHLALTQCGQCKMFNHLKCIQKWEKTLKHNKDRGLCTKCRAKIL
jgi:hypothetical protein